MAEMMRTLRPIDPFLNSNVGNQNPAAKPSAAGSKNASPKAPSGTRCAMREKYNIFSALSEAKHASAPIVIEAIALLNMLPCDLESVHISGCDVSEIGYGVVRHHRSVITIC